MGSWKLLDFGGLLLDPEENYLYIIGATNLYKTKVQKTESPS